MIITRTPFRISFIGGGSDIKEFYSEFNGAVLSTTINKYMYISSHKYFDRDKLRIKYSKTETVDNVNEINHPIFKVVLKKFGINGGLEISSISDVLAGTGVGSSSSFTVGLLHNLYTRNNLFVTKDRLAEEACDIEINMLKEPIGKQDQYAAAFGGFSIIKFNQDDSVYIEKLHIKKEILSVLEDNLILFYIGMQRNTSEILHEQKANMSNDSKKKILNEMVSLVCPMRDSLYNNKLDDFARILNENWLLKRQLASKITNTTIDDLYKKALENNAKGGKLLGAGAGGFLLFYCEKEYQEKLKEAMQPYRDFPFLFENEGSKVIYFGDEN